MTSDNSAATPLQHGGFPIPKRLPAHLHSQLTRRLCAAFRGLPGPQDTVLREAAWRKYCNPSEAYMAFCTRFDSSKVTFRPDICIFMGGSLASEQTWSSRARSRTNRACGWSGYVGSRVVHIVEVGYAREGFGHAKQLEKLDQHLLLQLLLEQNQWTVHYHTVTLGVAGTIPRCT